MTRQDQQQKVTALRSLHLIRPSGPPSPQGEGFHLVPTQAADKRATLGAQGNSPPGLGTDEGRGELGTAQPNHPGASATTQVSFRARRSQTGQSRDFPGATRRRLFAYFFWKKYDPFLVGTSRRVPQVGGPPQPPCRHPAPLCEGAPRGKHKTRFPSIRRETSFSFTTCFSLFRQSQSNHGSPAPFRRPARRYRRNGQIPDADRSRSQPRWCRTRGPESA